MGVVVDSLDLLYLVADVIYVIGAAITLLGGVMLIANVRRWPKFTGRPTTPIHLKRSMGGLLIVASCVFAVGVAWKWAAVFASPLAVPLLVVQSRIKKHAEEYEHTSA
ncbi:hypothetical protein GCM10010151_51410 [Actinoallomurus spadix]|uniref:Integral membrane protein n=1 Tax=Actinoallomurus spadix TaxID=79912 RepID=A0ABN0X5C0_9ACTN